MALRKVALIARSETNATALVNSLRAVVRKLDPEMPFYQVRTMEQIVDALFLRCNRRVRAARSSCTAS